LLRQAIPVFWWAKAKRRILATLMQMGDDVHVLDDVTIVHRGIREHFPFFCYWSFRVIVVVVASSTNTIVYTDANELVRISRTRESVLSKTLIQLKNRREAMERLLYDAGLSVAVQGYVVCPNEEGVFVERVAGVFLPLERVVEVFNALPKQYTRKHTKGITKNDSQLCCFDTCLIGESSNSDKVENHTD